MKRFEKKRIKPPRIVPENKLEKLYDGSKNWVEDYIRQVTEKHRSLRLMLAPSTSSTNWKADDLDLDTEESVEDEEDIFCCHDGCSFRYNVQDSCLERASFIMESVPRTTYLKLAPHFGMDPRKKTRLDGSNRCKLGHLDSEDEDVENFIHLVETEMGYRRGASTDGQVEVGTLRNSIRDDPAAQELMQNNPYLKYIKRTSTKAQLASARNYLGRKSNEITKFIIKDFLEWFKSIGGEDEETTIDEAILQDLFQIGFDSPTARAITLRIKEMPVVPESLAHIRNEPEFAVKKGLRKLVRMDIRLEQKPQKLYAFGTMLPKEEPSLRFQPPKNEIRKTWTECERVPPELESLKLVWEGIEDVRSTIAFSSWLKKHPEIKPPGYLKEKGLLNINYEEWMQMFKGFEKEFPSEETDQGLEPTHFEDESVVSSEPVRSMRAEEFNTSGHSIEWKG